jgi:hypothetical protein
MMIAQPLCGLLGAGVLALAACAAPPTAVRLPDPPTRILWIGNSNTQFNDLPWMVRGMARAAGLPDHEFAAAISAGASLQEHYEDGVIEHYIATAPWDVVILQQGASATPDGRAHLLHWSGMLAPAIRDAGAVPAIFGVWPSYARQFDFDAARESHQAAARSIRGAYVPLSEAWRAAWRRDPTLELYGDNVHPTVAGTLLNAYVFVAHLYGVPAVGLPTAFAMPESQVFWDGFSFDPAKARLLQEAADEALAAHAIPRRP